MTTGAAMAATGTLFLGDSTGLEGEADDDGGAVEAGRSEEGGEVTGGVDVAVELSRSGGWYKHTDDAEKDCCDTYTISTRCSSHSTS
jgi:hypothetical protein